MPDFTGTIAAASATAAMLFLLAVTLGLISPSPRPIEAAQAIVQHN